jgi:hypothetical protein
MRAHISTITAAIFLVWILPLGIFIKPDEEKLACNGKRAICMCSHLLAKQTAKFAGKILLKNAVDIDGANGAPASHFYVNAVLAGIRTSADNDTVFERSFFYSDPTRKTADPVPKFPAC